jgi:serine/threonine-protein kinase
VRLIRSGLTTQVWEATQIDKTERVALKVLTQEYRKNKIEIEQLKHEMEVGRSMSHPNVITIYQYMDQYNLPLLSMQLFNARNLKIEMRENREMVIKNLTSIIRKCALGLQHLHEQGWVHCDVKPDNFLVNKEGDVKLIDFSIAEKPQKKGLSSLFTRRERRGTRSYMSPEQIRCKSLDARSDIYGLGCVIFELFGGRTPYSASNPDELLQRHLKAALPNLQAAAPVTKEFSEFVRRCLSKDPKDRPRQMSDFLLEYDRLTIYRAGMGPRKIAREAAKKPLGEAE